MSQRHPQALATERLMRVAQGLEPADLAVRNASVLNVYTGELQPGLAVATAGERVAYLGPDGAAPVGEDTRVIDAEGQVVIPGLIDGHTHLVGARYSIDEALPYIVPGGTTCIITEIVEIASILGLEGILGCLDLMAGQPIALYATVPPLMALTREMEDVVPSLEEYRAILERPDVVGVGELYWGHVVQRRDRRLLDLVLAARGAGRVVEGHGAGAKGTRLMAYACAGFQSCHEPINAEEVLERLRLGFHAMVREGRVRQELEAVAPLWRRGNQAPDLRRLVLVTDSVAADDLVESGYLERVVQRAIELGLDPARAIQAATLNVAEHFGLAPERGGIAPGRYADLAVVPDLRTIRPRLVVANGRVVAEEGRLSVPYRRHTYPEGFTRTVQMPRPLAPADFQVAAASSDGLLRVRAIEMLTPLVTRETELEMKADDGVLKADVGDDVALVGLLDRLTKPGRGFVGLLKGFGMGAGGYATTTAWDCHALLVLGMAPSDMALAANRVVEMRGGAAVYAGGELLAELSAPVGGIVSQAPLPAVSAQERAVDGVLKGLGARGERPSLSLDVLTTAAIPHFRLSEDGYVRVRDGTVVGLLLDP